MVDGGGGGVESKFSVQLRPKLNKRHNTDYLMNVCMVVRTPIFLYFMITGLPLGRVRKGE